MAHTHYRTRGIVLKQEDQGEADQNFSIFTEDFGKVELVGKAIRKITSKLRAGVAPFYFSEIEFIQGKNQKTLTDVVLIDKFQNLRDNQSNLAVAVKIAEVVDFFVVEQEKDNRVWQLLLDAFEFLKLQSVNPSKPRWQTSGLAISGLTLSDKPFGLATLIPPMPSIGACRRRVNHSIAPSVFHFFLWNFLTISGYSPELYHCTVCTKKLLPETFFFVPKEGGIVCWQCFDKIKQGKEKIAVEQGMNGKEKNQFLAREGIEITVGAVKVLRVFLSESITFLERLRIGENDLAKLEQTSEFYLNFLRER